MMAALDNFALGWIALALVTCAVLWRLPAPFGRHTSLRWGPTLDNRLGWLLMELPSLGLMVWFASSAKAREGYVWILFALWIAHYAHRALIWPLRIRPTPKRMPLVIVASAIAFNVVNAGLNGTYLALTAPRYDAAWLQSAPFAIGLALFVLGAWINVHADTRLIALRRGGDTGYTIPRGFLFERVSAPNLLGEMIEWTGFAVMAWNLPALSFAVWTVANLLPRAVHHHAWYRATFPDYPPERRAVIPYVL